MSMSNTIKVRSASWMVAAWQPIASHSEIAINGQGILGSIEADKCNIVLYTTTTDESYCT